MNRNRLTKKYSRKAAPAFQVKGRFRRNSPSTFPTPISTLHSRVLRARARAFTRTARVRRVRATASAIPARAADEQGGVEVDGQLSRELSATFPSHSRIR